MDRQPAVWMTREDERILECLASDAIATPHLISCEVFKKVSEGHVRERLQMLQYAGLVACDCMDPWELTRRGERYLAGELNATHQPRPTVERVLRGRS